MIFLSFGDKKVKSFIQSVLSRTKECLVEATSNVIIAVVSVIIPIDATDQTRKSQSSAISAKKQVIILIDAQTACRLERVKELYTL